MTDVAGVLLDHVDQDVADLGGLAVLRHDRAEVVQFDGDILSVGHLTSPRRPRIGDHDRVGDGAVEVKVAVAAARAQSR